MKKRRSSTRSAVKSPPVIGPRDASRLMLLAMSRAGVKPLHEREPTFESRFAREVAAALTGKPASSAAKRAAENLVEGYRQRFLVA